jgi:hypothetical protein
MANRKYDMLADTQWLIQELKQKSMSELADELSIIYGMPKANLAGSIRFRVFRDLTEEERLAIKKERSFHKNVSKLRTKSKV